jgi:hypothetical protein
MCIPFSSTGLTVAKEFADDKQRVALLRQQRMRKRAANRVSASVVVPPAGGCAAMTFQCR